MKNPKITETSGAATVEVVEELSVTKRVIVFTGNKGGTGKSTVGRGALDLINHHQINWCAYDCDKANAHIYRHYKNVGPGVNRVDIFARGEFDVLLNNLETNQPDVILVDLPAGSAETFQRWDKETSLIDSFEQLGYRFTAVSVLSRVKDSVIALKLLIDYFGDKIDYVIAKNLCWGEAQKFSRYDNSETKQRVESLAGVEIRIPELFERAYDAVDNHNLSFREATGSKKLMLADRTRVANWLKDLEAELMKAPHLFGLPNERMRAEV